MRHSPNSHSCSQQFAHVYQGLLASVSPPPPCLCSQKEAAAGHLKCMRRKYTWFRLTVTGPLCFSVLFIYGRQHVTYSLVRIGADESKQLPQQDTVGGLVPAVLDGQWLQKREGAAPVAGHMAPPTEKKTVGSEKQETLRECGFLLKSIQLRVGIQPWPLAIYLWFALVNSKSSLPIISRSEGADMLRRKTGCRTAWDITFVSEADLQAGTERNKRVHISAIPFVRIAVTWNYQIALLSMRLKPPNQQAKHS